MKKLTCLAGFALFAMGAFAQGTIIFGNDAATLVTTNNGINSGAVVGAMQGRVTLWYSTAVSAPAVPGPGNNFSFAGWTQSTPTTPDNAGVPTAGRFAGGTQTLDTAAGGSSPWIFVAGWTGGFADFATALADAIQNPVTTAIGVSGTWQNPTGNPNGAPPTPAASMVLGPSGFNGLQLFQIGVPEPSSLALAGLGAAALLVFRRRK
jgi:hypothetical protein